MDTPFKISRRDNFTQFPSIPRNLPNVFIFSYCGKKGPRDVILVGSLTMRFSTSSFFPGIGFRCSLSPLVDDGDEGHTPTPKESSHCVCGINKIGTRVVNGTETQQGEVPWQAGLVRGNESVPFCGGSLINGKIR